MARAAPVRRCRACGSGSLQTVLDLGSTPIANALVRPGSPAEERYPLAIALCRGCALIQTTCWIPGEILFGSDYPYFSSYSDSYLRHAQRYAESLIERFALDADSFVVEIASNDGYLLRNFVDRGVPALGVDPAAGPGAAARKLGVPTRSEYFGSSLARELRAEKGAADVIIGNNVLAHVDDPGDLAAGVASLLGPRGAGVFEVPYLLELVEHRAFDTIYHEHNCYFSLVALENLFASRGLHVFDVQPFPVHGGSIRVFVGRDRERSELASDMFERERTLRVGEPEYYASLPDRVATLRRSLLDLLDRLSDEGKRVAAYGATAKGVSLAHIAGLDADRIEYAVDRNPHKQGLLLPGVRIPIVSPCALEVDPPDCLLLLAWNLADEIREQLRTTFQGDFILPVPEPRIL